MFVPKWSGTGEHAAMVARLSDCEAAFDGRYFADTNYDFVDLYSVSVIAVPCYMGPRYNATLVISFMNVMPVLMYGDVNSSGDAISSCLQNAPCTMRLHCRRVQMQLTTIL